MKRIVECLLEAGIMEEDIHRILDLIEEEYEVVDEATMEQNATTLYKKQQDPEAFEKFKQRRAKFKQYTDSLTKDQYNRLIDSEETKRRNEQPYRVGDNRSANGPEYEYRMIPYRTRRKSTDMTEVPVTERPDYLHAKRIAYKALKGRKVNTRDTRNLYRIGKKIIKNKENN